MYCNLQLFCSLLVYIFKFATILICILVSKSKKKRDTYRGLSHINTQSHIAILSFATVFLFSSGN